jgi:hypothetical protein
MDDVARAAIGDVLLRVLGTGSSTDGRLHQTFTIPQSSVEVEATAQSLQIQPGSLSILYEVPLFKDRGSIQLPQPEVAIVQQMPVPTARTVGTPITARLQARVVKESIPPYDFAWTTDSAPAPTEGTEREVTGPALNGATGTHTLTTAYLRMTDLLGQVATTSRPVQYHVRRARHWGRSLGAMAAVVALLLLALVGTLVILPIIQAATTPTTAPTPTMTVPPVAPIVAFQAVLGGPAQIDPVTNTWEQVCFPSGPTAGAGTPTPPPEPPLESATITLDNSQSNVAVSWNLTFTSDPQDFVGVNQDWATATNFTSPSPVSSGTVPAHGTTILTITPVPQLCNAFSFIAGPSSVRLSVNLTYSPQNPGVSQPVVFTDLVSQAVP